MIYLIIHLITENIPSNDPNAIEIPDEIKSGFPYVLIW